MKQIKYILSLCLLLIFGSLQAQNRLETLEDYQRAYRNAKDLFDLQKYNLAMEAFRPLIIKRNQNPFDKYASFYYGLSAYHGGDTAVARDMFSQITSKYPDWEQLGEVNTWLARINFEKGNYFQAFRYVKKLEEQKKNLDKDMVLNIRKMKQHFLGKSDDVELLKNLYQEYPGDTDVGIALAKTISQKPYKERDMELLKSVIDELRLDPEDFNMAELKTVKKDEYHVAVMLPLMFDDLQPFRGRRSNQFIMDIYEGIKMAHELLTEQGVKIHIHTFDTERSRSKTEDLLASNRMKQMDAIVGPLYPEPVKLVADFALKNQINMINPLSSNSLIIENNPFAFLYNPSAETMARETAEFVSDTLTNKNTIIFYGPTYQDSVIAYQYKMLLKQDSFDIVAFKEVDRENSKIIFQTLASTYEIDDTLALDNESEKIEVFEIKNDSIGHVFVASTDRLLASNVISSVEAREDTIQIVGFGDWLNHRSADYNVIEKLGVWLIAPNFPMESNIYYRVFRDNYIEKNYELPTQNAVIGYDLMLFLGNNLNRFGKYFQVGAYELSFKRGYIKIGYDYRFSNDNQAVPIIKLVNDEPVIINDVVQELKTDLFKSAEKQESEYSKNKD